LREAAELKGWIINIIMDQLVPFAIAGLFARLQASQTIEDTLGQTSYLFLWRDPVQYSWPPSKAC